jgi:hypothetical protein
MWRQQHVVGHHAFTNVDNYDPDIRKLRMLAELVKPTNQTCIGALLSILIMLTRLFSWSEFFLVSNGSHFIETF